MPNDFKFDPTTGDIIPDGNGAYVMTPYNDTVLQLQLECHYGECWHDAQLGSRLHDLRFFQPDPVNMVPDELKRALNVLASRGYVGSIQASAVRVNAGRVDATTVCRDLSSGNLITQKTTLTQPGGS